MTFISYYFYSVIGNSCYDLYYLLLFITFYFAFIILMILELLFFLISH
jgi:hypothetical protein